MQPAYIHVYLACCAAILGLSRGRSDNCPTRGLLRPSRAACCVCAAKAAILFCERACMAQVGPKHTHVAITIVACDSSTELE